MTIEIQPDGGFVESAGDSDNLCVDYAAGSRHVYLEGCFTPEELRTMAMLMGKSLEEKRGE